MENYLPIISILFLIAAVIIGFTKKLNMGILAIGLALILGRIGGISDNEIISGFGTSTFVMLLGVTFFFSIAQSNDTLELISRKTIALAGKKTWLIPILVLILSIVLSALGPGNIPVGILLSAFSATLAIELGINILAIAPFAIIGANAGCMSPIANGGIIGANLGQQAGYAGFTMSLFINCALAAFLFGILVYIYFKGYKIKAENPIKLSDLPAFNHKQLLTLGGMLALIIVTAIFKINVGLAAFCIAIILLLLNAGSQKQALSGIPWGTLILVCGMSVLMKVVVSLGGIAMISDGLKSMMNPYTASPIVALTSGIMSWFSSTTGVVMPTMIPTLPAIADAFSTVGFSALISASTSTAFSAALSPVSTGGAMILAAYIAATHAGEKEQNKLFKDLFLMSVIAVLFNVLLAALGLFGIF